MKSTDMKQTSETRKNFEEGWDAIFGDNKKIRRNREKPRVIAPIIPSLSSLLGEVPGEFDEAIKNSHGCSPDFLKEDSGTIKDSLTVAAGLSSSSSKMFFAWRLMFCLVVWNNSAISS